MTEIEFIEKYVMLCDKEGNYFNIAQKRLA
jgi:hypothetical protein